MSRILICPTQHADEALAAHGPSHVVRLDGPTRPGGDLEEACPAIRRAGARDRAARALRLVFHDIAAPRPGLVAPSVADMAALISFAGDWDRARPILVHCEMGISRSTAAALILALAAWPRLDEAELAASLRAAAPCATPNPLMIALADELLGRSGRLVAAVRLIGRGAEYEPYRMFALDPACGS